MSGRHVCFAKIGRWLWVEISEVGENRTEQSWPLEQQSLDTSFAQCRWLVRVVPWPCCPTGELWNKVQDRVWSLKGFCFVSIGDLIKMSFPQRCNKSCLRGAPLLIAFISKVLSEHMFNLQKDHSFARVPSVRYIESISGWWGTGYLYFVVLAMRYG